MIRVRREHDERAAGLHHTRNLSDRERTEDRRDDIDACVEQRHVGAAGDEPVDRAVAFRCAFDRTSADVDCGGLLRGSAHRDGVPAFAAAAVEQVLGPQAQQLIDQGRAQRFVMAGLEKVRARDDHRRVVTGIEAVLSLNGQQIEVAVARAIERVALRARRRSCVGVAFASDRADSAAIKARRFSDSSKGQARRGAAVAFGATCDARSSRRLNTKP